MSKRVKVVLTEAELEALKEALRARFDGPLEVPEPLGTAYDKIAAALWGIAEEAE